MDAEWPTLRETAGALPPWAALSLEQSGFVVLPGPFSAERFDEVAGAYDAEFASAASVDVREGSTSTRVPDFVNCGPLSDPLYVYPPLLDAATRVVGPDFKLSSFGARTLHAGASVLDIHVDVERDSPDWPLLGFILMIDEFKPDNGATRFIPGSHQWIGSPRRVRLQDPATQLVSACAPPGSLLVFNGSTWHGKGINEIRSATPVVARRLHSARRPRGHGLLPAHVGGDAGATGCGSAICAGAPRRGPPCRLRTCFGSAMKAAALQVPLPSLGAREETALIRRRRAQCEAEASRSSAVPRPLSAAWPRLCRGPEADRRHAV